MMKKKICKINNRFLHWRQIYNVNAGENHEFQLRGEGVDQEPFNVFSVDSHNGEVYVHRAIDREKYNSPFHVSNHGAAVYI